MLEIQAIPLLLSTYQAGKLLAMRQVQGNLWTLLCAFGRSMGMAVRVARQVVLGTLSGNNLSRFCFDMDAVVRAFSAGGAQFASDMSSVVNSGIKEAHAL
jgi:hypothetical protein